MTGDGPSAEELTDTAVSRILAACDAERLTIRCGVRGDPAFDDEVLADFAAGRLRPGGRGPGGP